MVTLFPCISATAPETVGSVRNRSTPRIRVSMGVIVMCLKRSLLGAMLVSERLSKGGGSVVLPVDTLSGIRTEKLGTYPTRQVPEHLFACLPVR